MTKAERDWFSEKTISRGWNVNEYSNCNA